MTTHITAIIDRLQECSVDEVPDCVEALAVGGSYARATQDQYSDLDLFVILQYIEPMAIPDIAPLIVNWIGSPPAVSRGPTFVPHFGYSMTLVFDDLSICQMNLNTMQTLELNPMRAHSSIIIDRTGELTSLVMAATKLPADLREVYVELYNYFWIRALYGWRSLQRGELWRTASYLADIRRPILQLARIRCGGYDPSVSPYTPATRIEQIIGDQECKKLAFCLSLYTAEDMSRCLRASVTWFTSATQSMPYNAALSRSELAIARQIGALILGVE